MRRCATTMRNSWGAIDPLFLSGCIEGLRQYGEVGDGKRCGE